MPRSIKSLSQRLAAKEVAEALQTVTTTDRLLAEILIELMNTRAERQVAELAERLRRCGFSTAQAAGIIGTTVATLHVSEQRRKTAQARSPRALDGDVGSIRDKGSYL